MRARLAILAALLAPCLLAAQREKPRALPEVHVSATAWQPPPPTILSRTSLVEVPVVVRAQDGRAVAGLPRSRFRLFDNGTPRPIELFSEVDRRAGGPTRPAASRAPTPGNISAPPRPRYVALFFDDVATTAADLIEARNAAERFLKGGIGRRDRIAIFTASSTVSLGFTRSVPSIEAALARLSVHPRASRHGLTNCPIITPYEAYMIAVYHDPMALAAVSAEARVCESGMAPFEARLIPALADASWALERGSAFDLLKAVDDVVAYLGRQPGRRTLVFTSGGFVSCELGELKSDMVRRALKPNVTINALDARGLYTDGASRPLNDPSDYPGPLPLQTWEFEQINRLSMELADEAAMRQLARGTGGAFFHNDNDLTLGFQRLSKAPAARYELGFDPVGLRHNGKFHRLEVKLVPRLTGAKLEARRGYFAPPARPSPAALDLEMDSAMRTRGAITALPAVLRVHAAGRAVTIEVMLNAVRLAFVKRGHRRLQQVVVIAALFGPGSRFVAGERGVLDLALRNATWKRLRRQGIVAALTLHAPPGAYRLRVVALASSIGKLSAFSRRLSIP
jgi:VWFA-related protein